MNKSILYILSLFVFFSWSLISGCDKASMDSIGETRTSPQGKSGSTARIVVKGNYLYAVDNTSLKVVNITNPADPTYVRTIDIGFGIETIYPFGDYLFVGSNMGMFIYGLNDPSNPNQLSAFEHITACDPVIANDSLAFVTLRNNEVCNRWAETKQIEIINIQDVFNPTLDIIYPTQTYPYGLDMLDTLLFVCHGSAGVVIYDINKMVQHQMNAQVASITGFNLIAYDAIFWQNKLFVIGQNGFYQFDYSDIHNITLISSILKNQ